MADPVLDEDNIVSLLKAPATVDCIDMIQGGAVQALCDLYDRKTTRDEFTTGAAKCLALYGQGAKMWVLNNIKQVYAHGNLDEACFQRAEQGLAQLLRKQAEEVIELVRRLQECPTSDKRVH